MRLEGLPSRVSIVEVGPRDGLQNERALVPTPAKADLVRGLVRAGLRDIEVGSFVRPDLVPQLADGAALFAALGEPPPGVRYSALVPNTRGFEAARAAGVRHVAVFTAASESFSRQNTSASIAETLARFRAFLPAARADGIAVRGYVSTAIACPFEGWMAPQAVLEVVEALFELGCEEVSVGDTIGAATPGDVARLLDVLLSRIAPARLALHFHDTRGTALANVVEGLRHGIVRYDASIGGLGGCPFAPGAAGNLATEDLVFLLDGFGIEHGVGWDLLLAAGAGLEDLLGKRPVSRVRAAPGLPPRPR